MTFPFIPYSKRWPAIPILLAGLALGILWGFKGFKPEFLNVPVFAVYSSYLKKVIFGISQTNLTDELAFVLLLIGLLWLVCSKEKKEEAGLDMLRYKALIVSVLINSGILLLAALFIFGIGFIQVMIINLFSQPVIYLTVLRVLLYRSN